jgi:lysophospholipase L1-like esterase
MRRLIVGLLLAGTIATPALAQSTAPTLSINNVTVNEGAGTAVLRVTRNNPNGTASSFRYRTKTGTAVTTDYSTRSGTVILSATQNTFDISVPIVNDTRIEQAETFQVELFEPIGVLLANNFGNITITDNDGVVVPPPPPPITYSASPVTVVEGQQATINVCRTGTGTTTLTYKTSDDTAVAPADYTARDSVRTFTDTSLCQSLIVQTIDDTVVEGTEQLFMNLNGTVKVAITIQDNDVAPPPPTGPIENKIAFTGDSLSVFGTGMYTGLYAAANPTVATCFLAVGGSDIGSVTARKAQVDTCNSEVVSLLIGANDAMAPDFLTKVFAFTDMLRADGRKVILGTILPQNNPTADSLCNCPWTANFNVKRNTVLNPAFRAAVGVHVDAIADYAANPTIGVDAAALNTALFPDGTHPSGSAHQIMHSIFNPEANKLLAQVGPTKPPVVTPPPTDPILGAPPIPSNFDINTAILTGQPIPGSGAPDVVGAFRFICQAGQISNDDPILYPGQVGRSHLHQYYGNTGANANSTYESLRTTGGSSCNQVGDFWSPTAVAGNRSAYWMPAMMEGTTVVKPDYVSIYYKRRPATDPIVSDPTNPKYAGKAVELPNGLRFIFGFDPTGINSIRTGGMWFNCVGPTAKSGHYLSLSTALANCPAGQGNQVGAVIGAPDCWNGKDLDSADHRSHVAFSSYGSWGYAKCPTTHPYVIPTFTLGAWYSVKAGDSTGIWEFSSAHMAPGQPSGYTFHADFFAAWDEILKDEWHNGCINKLLNCDSGNMGLGRKLKGAGTPLYLQNGQWITSWTIPETLRKTPLPAGMTVSGSAGH